MLIFTFLVIFSSVVYSQNETVVEPPFEVELSVIKDKIDFSENAEFKIKITNPRNSIEVFTIKPAAPYVEWFIKTRPVSDYNVKVYPESIREVLLVAKPIGVGIGRYALRINIKHEDSGELFKNDIIVNVVSLGNIPAVSISGKVPEKIDPREPFEVTVWLENRNAKNLEEITVELKSDAIRESTISSLGPLDSGSDKKTLKFNVLLDKRTPPIKDNLRIHVIAKDGKKIYELKSAPYGYEVLKYGGVVDNHNPSFRVLGKYDRVMFVNDGNTKFDGFAKLESPFYKALFTRTNPKAESFVEDGKRYLGWKVKLDSQETYNVVVKTNYIPLFIVLVVLGVFFFYYFKFRSPVIITKSVQNIVKTEGGITNFKVILHIKNRSKKPIDNVSIIDRIPDIADFDKEEGVGTLQPEKVVHTKRGIIAKWVINNLDREEETVIKYGVKSRLSILGKLPLPSTIAKFKDEKGEVKRSYSNKVIIGS
ncbi:hypothetical protein CEE44_04830 [Candidatus Woesearchaeota archaeon B3_Woes]|nr:MAG: hypothetical protein CEE44_04830 [Candidatus Woesearchaeota archaeon B3_Woes]